MNCEKCITPTIGIHTVVGGEVLAVTLCSPHIRAWNKYARSSVGDVALSAARAYKANANAMAARMGCPNPPSAADWHELEDERWTVYDLVEPLFYEWLALP